MIYILRDLLAMVLPPAGLLLCIAVAAWRSWRVRRAWPLILVWGAAWVVSTPWTGEQLVHGLEYRVHRGVVSQGDAIIVLGEGAVPHTPQNQGSGSLSGVMAGEYLSAVDLARQTHLPIILSGGKGSFGDGNESLIGRAVLRGLGVSPIYVDARSQTTYENAVNSAAILRRHHWTRPILLTSAFHMVQAIRDFRAVGVDVIPYPTGYQTSRRLKFTPGSWIPSSAGLALTTEALQEDVSLAAIALGIKL